MKVTVNIEDTLMQKGMALAGVADFEAFLNLAVSDFIRSEQAAGFAGVLLNMSPSETKQVYADFFNARDGVLKEKRTRAKGKKNANQ